MSIRLSKVVKELNVGISTVVDFLHKKGIEVESDPNTKIEDEHFDLLIKEFGKDKSMKIEAEKITQQRHQKEKKESLSIQGYERNQPVKEAPAEVPTPVEFSPQHKFKPVGKIDLDSVGKRKPVQEEEPEVIEPAPVQPIKEIPVEIEIPPIVEVVPEPIPTFVPEPEPQPEPESEPQQVIPQEEIKPMEPIIEIPQEKVEVQTEQIFKVAVEETPHLKVLRTIDLSTLNQTTRPAKKSKEEKKKEREDRNVTRNGQRPQLHKAPAGNTPSTTTSTSTQSDLDAKKKRNRIQKEKVDINKVSNQKSFPKPSHDKNKPPTFRRPIKPAVSEEEVQQQVKETLARLTAKSKSKGSKHRRDKREAFSNKMMEAEELEQMESGILKITEFVTANDLATMMNISVTQVISTCMNIGMMVSINQRLDAETINIVAEEFGFKTEYVSAEVIQAITEEEDSEEDLLQRPPIVTVMGHVDHGKTSLLDYVRNTNVIAGEAGGITQHIGAYHVKLADGRQITFLDTPGHEAFTAMRARGAKVTDIAIIIVAADDDVMPQTIEAINHASAAGVPIVFAINKIDKPAANPEKIKEALAGMNYLVEDWGGKYQSQDISSKKGIGITELLDKVLLEAEMLDLKANPNKRASGSVIESTLDKGRGYVATILVQNGTLKVGDCVLAGTNFGRVKAMFNERNQRIQEAGPSEPTLILGLNGAPAAGDTFNVMETDQEAREVATKREQLQREQGIRTQKILTLDDIGRRIAIGNFQELNIIVKGDVDGSIEALSDSLIKLSTEEIQVNVIHKAVGQISESDVTLAAASNAIIVGFQVRPSGAARKNAEQEGVDIRLYSIIYNAIEEIKAAMEGMLSPEIKEVITGTAEIREVFKISKVGNIAGCMVKEGKIKRNNKMRLIRDGIVVYSGELGSLKRFKDDVKEVSFGYDCGLNIERFNDIKLGDLIESYEEVEVSRSL